MISVNQDNQSPNRFVPVTSRIRNRNSKQPAETNGNTNVKKQPTSDKNRKPGKTSVRVVGLRAEISTRELANTKQEC
jgi:hypothetical protein